MSDYYNCLLCHDYRGIIDELINVFTPGNFVQNKRLKHMFMEYYNNYNNIMLVLTSINRDCYELSLFFSNTEHHDYYQNHLKYIKCSIDTQLSNQIDVFLNAVYDLHIKGINNTLSLHSDDYESCGCKHSLCVKKSIHITPTQSIHNNYDFPMCNYYLMSHINICRHLWDIFVACYVPNTNIAFKIMTMYVTSHTCFSVYYDNNDIITVCHDCFVQIIDPQYDSELVAHRLAVYLMAKYPEITNFSWFKSSFKLINDIVID
jgi:hypothetical protein